MEEEKEAAKVEFEVELEQPVKTRIRSDSVEGLVEGLRAIQKGDFLEACKQLPTAAYEAKNVVKASSPSVETPGYPAFSANLGVTDALNVVAGSEWLKAKPRLSKEISDCLRINAILCSAGQLSDRLVKMTKQGIFRRIDTPEGYAYGPGSNAGTVNGA